MGMGEINLWVDGLALSIFDGQYSFWKRSF